MKNLKAILFDMDGTLVDSEDFHYKSWKGLLGSFGHKLNYENYYLHYAGVSPKINAQKLIDEFDVSEPVEQLIKKREETILQILRTEPVKLMPYALDILNSFSALGIQLGLVTSASHAEASLILPRAKLSGFFHKIITRDDVVCTKPNPEPYLKGLAAINFHAEECLAIEDSISGIQSAKGAGLACLAVQRRFSATYKSKCTADALFENLREAEEYVRSSFLGKKEGR